MNLTARSSLIASPADAALDRRRRAMRSLALAVLVLLVFGRCATHEFVNFDDGKFIFANPNLVPPSLAGLAHQWSAPYAQLYVPVASTLWWILAVLGLVSNGAGGYTLNPWLFHLANVLLHLANVLLVRRIAKAIVRDDLAATLGAAIFAVHPLQVEAVAWASELKDLLCGLFSLLAILACIKATDPTFKSPATSEPEDAKPSRFQIIQWLPPIACYVLALLSKPSAVTLPIVVTIVLWLLGRRSRTQWLVLLIGLVLAVPIVILTRHAQQAIGVAPSALWSRPLIATDALAFYVQKLIWPFSLAVDYGRTPAAVVASSAIYWTWIIPLAVSALVLLSRARALIGGWMIFIAAAAGNLGLLTFQFQVYSTVSDHYVYLSMLGAAIGIAYLASRARHPAQIRSALALLIAAMGLAAFVQAGYWRDSMTLWRHVIEVNPRSILGYDNLGAALLSGNDAAGAIPPLERAAKLDPDDSFAWLYLTRAQLGAGQTRAAADSAIEMVRAYRLRPDFNAELTASVLDRFAQALRQEGDAPSADRLRDAAGALRSKPR